MILFKKVEFMELISTHKVLLYFTMADITDTYAHCTVPFDWMLTAIGMIQFELLKTENPIQ